MQRAGDTNEAEKKDSRNERALIVSFLLFAYIYGIVLLRGVARPAGDSRRPLRRSSDKYPGAVTEGGWVSRKVAGKPQV